MSHLWSMQSIACNQLLVNWILLNYSNIPLQKSCGFYTIIFVFEQVRNETS